MSNERIVAGQKTTAETFQNFKSTEEAFQSLQNLSRETLKYAEDQAEATKEIVTTLNELNTATQQTSAAWQVTSERALSLASLSKEIDTLADQLNLMVNGR